MNDIVSLKAAALYIEEHSNKQDYSLEALDRLKNAVDHAVNALEENQQREQGCEYCKSLKNLYFNPKNDYIGEIYIKLDGTMTVLYSPLITGDNLDIGINFEINFCPKCGRRLKHE